MSIVGRWVHDADQSLPALQYLHDGSQPPVRNDNLRLIVIVIQGCSEAKEATMLGYVFPEAYLHHHFGAKVWGQGIHCRDQRIKIR